MFYTVAILPHPKGKNKSPLVSIQQALSQVLGSWCQKLVSERHDLPT